MLNNKRRVPGKKSTPKENDIHREEERLQSERRAFLPALVGVSRKLLTSTASIKAAISSLLYDDILWDPINQHEFLEIIDESADQLSDLLTLVLLTFRAEANLIILHPEPYLVEEILGKVKQQISAQLPRMDLNLTIPEDRVTIYADYDYLVLMVSFIIQVIDLVSEQKKILLQTREKNDRFFLIFNELEENTFRCLQQLMGFHPDNEGKCTDIKLSPEALLKGQLIRHLMKMQEINGVFGQDSDQRNLFQLDIPIYKKGMATFPEDG
jgi:hypothetical protein